MEEQIELPTISTIASKLFFYSFDFFRIYFTVQFLTDRYTDQAFNEVGRYGSRPSVDADHYRKTSGPIMLGSVLIALMVTGINAYYFKKNNIYLAAQDYVYALFSSSIIFFVGDLFSTTGYMPALSAFQFFIISLVGVLAMMAIFLKLATPLSSSNMIFAHHPQTQLRYFDEYAKAFPNPNKTERLLNALGSVGQVASLSTFFWVLNHEIHNGVSPLVVWQKVILGLGAGSLALFGSYAITDHPKYYLAFLMAVIFLNAGAMTYAGVSAFACYIDCKKHNTDIVAGFSMFAALLTGLFSATHIQYRTEDTHESNLKMEKMLGKISDKVSGFFSRCCKKDGSLEPREESLELEVFQLQTPYS